MAAFTFGGVRGDQPGSGSSKSTVLSTAGVEALRFLSLDASPLQRNGPKAIIEPSCKSTAALIRCYFSSVDSCVVGFLPYVPKRLCIIFA